MSQGIKLSSLSPINIDAENDYVLFITPNTESNTNYNTFIGHVTVVPSSSYSVISGYAKKCTASFTNPFNQDLNTYNSVTFKSASITGELTLSATSSCSYTFPSQSGLVNQTLVSDGAGKVNWEHVDENFYQDFTLTQSSFAGTYTDLSGSVALIIPDDCIKCYKLNVFGIRNTGEIGMWRMEFSVINQNSSSVFGGDIRTENQVYYTATSNSCEMSQQSDLANQLDSSSVKLTLQPNELLLQVKNLTESSGSISTIWSASIETKTIYFI